MYCVKPWLGGRLRRLWPPGRSIPRGRFMSICAGAELLRQAAVWGVMGTPISRLARRQPIRRSAFPGASRPSGIGSTGIGMFAMPDTTSRSGTTSTQTPWSQVWWSARKTGPGAVQAGRHSSILVPTRTSGCSPKLRLTELLKERRSPDRHPPSLCPHSGKPSRNADLLIGFFLPLFLPAEPRPALQHGGWPIRISAFRWLSCNRTWGWPIRRSAFRRRGSYGLGGQATGWPSLAAHCMTATNLGDWAGSSS